MVNIGTRLAGVNIAFVTANNVVLVERKMLQYTTFSTKLHHCILGKLKAPAFTVSDVLLSLSKICADQKQHSNSDFLTKFNSNAFQTSINIAFEYLRRKV